MAEERGGEVAREMIAQVFLKSIFEMLKGEAPTIGPDEVNAGVNDPKRTFGGILEPMGHGGSVTLGRMHGKTANLVEALATGRGFGPEDLDVFFSEIIGKDQDLYLDDPSGVTVPKTLMHESMHALTNEQGTEESIRKFDELVSTGKAPDNMIPGVMSRKGMNLDDLEILAGIVRLFEDKMGVSSSTGKDF